MSMPVTALDERFSDPKAVATGWDETRRALDEAELFWITTVRPDGRPHVTPLVAVWLDGALYFCTGDTEHRLLCPPDRRVRVHGEVAVRDRFAAAVVGQPQACPPGGCGRQAELLQVDVGYRAAPAM